MFPRTDEDFYDLIDNAGPHHETKDPPFQREIDAHLLVLPADVQFAIDGVVESRLYSVTTNFSYYPVDVSLEFSSGSIAVSLQGTLKDAFRVGPLKKDNRPGIKGRFCKIASNVSGSRCDVGCNWSVKASGKPVNGELAISVETK